MSKYPIKLGKQVFTTGQIAKLCKVAPRTVSKWFDSGKLEGYRIPQSSDRRVTRESLVRFLKASGVPCGTLTAPCVLLCGVHYLLTDALIPLLAGVTVGDCTDAFTLGRLVQIGPPDVLILDASLGRSDALRLGQQVKVVAPDCRMIGLSGEDDAGLGWKEFGFHAVLQRPADPIRLAELVRELLAA